MIVNDFEIRILCFPRYYSYLHNQLDGSSRQKLVTLLFTLKWPVMSRDLMA